MDPKSPSVGASEELPFPARTERRRIPIGVEKLLYLAAKDAEFAEQLAVDRRSAVAASGISLTPTETALLANIPDGVLTQMIAGISPKDHERRSFMTKVAGAVALLSAGSACDGGDGDGLDAEIRDVYGHDGCRPFEAGIWDAGPEAGPEAGLDAETDATQDASVQSDSALDAAPSDAIVPDAAD